MDRFSQSARAGDEGYDEEFYQPSTSRFSQASGRRERTTLSDPTNPMFTYNGNDMHKYDLPASQPDGKLRPVLPTGPRPSGLRPKGRNNRPAADELEPDNTALGYLKTCMLEPIESTKDTALLSGSTKQSDDEIAAMAANLQSGEDAISFFACFGKNSPIKFVHLNQADKGIAFRPYDLEVVDPTKVNSSYYTMSESGLVKVQPGQPSEFIPLAEWMRHSTLFNLLTSIRFFKYYLSNKCFCAWRANVRFKLYCQQRRKLGNRLFLGKESFCNPLLKIKEYMLELQGVMLLDLGAQKTFESTAFVEYQAARRAEASKQFEAVMEHMQAEVQNVCTNVTNLARNTDQFEEMVDPSARNDKSRSLVSIKEEQAERRRILKRAAQEAGMLADFIRLADYISVCNLVELTILTNSDFLKELRKQPRKTGLFETTVLFDDDTNEPDITFNPPTPDIIAMVSQMTDAMISTVNSVSRILYTRPFTGYVQNVVVDGPNVASTIRASTEFKQIRCGIDEKIESDFVDAQGYVQIFDSVRPIFEYDRLWDFEAYSRQAHSVSSIKADMGKINAWEKELEKMRVGQTVGILHIESRKLKQLLLPMTNKKMECMKGLVKDLARAKCREQLVDYKHRIQTLVQRPAHLKDFSGHVEKLDALKGKLKSLQKNSAVVDEMYRLLSSYDVRIHSEDMVQLDDLRNVQEQYKEESDAADSYIEERMAEMTEQLDLKIGGLTDQVATVSDSVDEGVFIDESNFDEPEIVMQEIEAVENKLQSIEDTAANYTKMQELFGITVNQYKSLAKCKEKFKQVKTLWSTVDEWTKNYDTWMTSDFVPDEEGNVAQPADMEQVSKDVAVYFKDAYGMHKKMDNQVSLLLKERTSEFKLKLPVLMDLGNPNLKDRHWKKIYKQLRQPWDPTATFTMENLISWNVFDHKDLVGEQSATASGEAQLEASLEEIAKGWEGIEFVVINHRDAKDLYILGGLDEISMLLEDNQVTLQTMMGSRFIMGVREEVEEWAKKLSLLSDTLDEWVQVQRSWMYLETIFGAEDIQKQLPVEAAKFNTVDKAWRSTMIQTNHNPLVIASIEKGSDRLDLWQGCNATLEAIQKSLEEYLETKRMAFPRFYFLSNDELLEILSQTRDPHAVQPHMTKCFDAIKSIDFGTGDNATDILGMNSPESENVKFSSLLKAEGPVEFWLKGVETCMRDSLYAETKKSWLAYPPKAEAVNRAEWMFAYPAQVTIAVDQIYWTKFLAESITSVEDGSNKNAVEEFLEYSLEQIDNMVDLIRGELRKLDRQTLTAVITIDVHARDVVRTLVKRQISSSLDFEWTRQLRYYWEEEADNCFARQTNTRFRYNYEYLGNSMRLVITPLTDLCYMTLTGALHLRLGGAPAGPAGTGKTETTKDLAKALAVQCVVFNCSDGLDYKIMGRFFSGLAQAGAWACFDEFNRIDIEVLSVIAQQIMCIQRAINADLEEFEFEGNMIACNKNFGVFITMNPGYAGRTELPDNLKALFRPVAMMVPDYRLIAEIMLFAQGFSNALPLSNKMSQLYSLSSEQLSKQDHYDFGMRAVKSVLVAAGLLKRKEPDTWEDLLLIRAMRDSNVPKFLEADLPLFSGILSDLFPGVEVPFVDYGKLQLAIENQLTLANLQKHSSYVTKVIQVHETQLVRHGMMVVGETGAGKSTNVQILARALDQLKNDGVVDRDGFFQHTDVLALNPKSISAGELYGQFNLLSGEWSDGLVPKLVRECVALAEGGSTDRKWVMFDGPVDAVWIENMNTVLDDNKMLCLANSERIKLASTMHMMFEVQDLKVASPATVSRCGMVFMEQVHVGYLSLAEKWKLATMPDLLSPSQGEIVMNLIKEHTGPTLDFISYECGQKIMSSPANYMQSLLNLLSSMFKKAGADNPLMDTLLPLIFTFSFTWTLGANIDDNSREKFNVFLLDRLGSIAAGGGTFDNIYNYVVDEDTAQWVSWSSVVDHFRFDPAVPYFNLLVPTQDTTRYRFLLEKLLCESNNVLMMGETGVGKSVIVQSFLDDMSRTDNFVSFTMGYSAQTKPVNLKEVFETKLEKKRKTLFGPPAGKKMLMFIDDVNMPALEVYGAQPPNELLRQVIDSGGFYDTDKLFFKNVKDVVFATCCAPPGGGRNEVSPRLIRHFNMVWIPQISTASMTKIFEDILVGFLGVEFPSMANMGHSIVQASVDLYMGVQEHLLPTPAKSHYTFNLRDLSKVFQGVLMIKKKFCKEPSDLLKLWLHEEARVFRDRLIDDSDRDWFNTACQEKLETQLATEWQVEDFADLLFGDYLTRDDKHYQQVTSMKKLSDLLTEYLDEYNITFPSQMHLVFFNDAIAHVSRICRVLSQKRGNALLVGVGGSGRQSLTRLASFVADDKCFSIEINRGYGPTEFHDDLKLMLMHAGCENKHCVFLFSDTQVVEESFLEDVNNLLNSGEVPNLFEADEMERIVAAVRPLAKAAGKMETRDAILQHFVALVRDNLHCVLAFSPIGASFRNRCRMFPSLVNCCTIDWFSAWPEDALYSVAQRLLSENKVALKIEEYVEPLCNMAVIIHRSVEEQTARYFKELGRFNYTTPTSYLELIKLYVDILKEQREVVGGKEARYRGGLQKLAETEVMVADLQNKLVEMRPVLEQASKDTAELLVQVAKDQEVADKQQAVVEKDVEAANKVAASVKVIKDDCQKDLDEALPAYYSSIKALDSLDKKSIQELKSFANPPELVGLTLEAVCLLFGVKPEWAEAKKLMNDMKFLEKLKDFDKDNIEPKTIKKLNKYMKNGEFVPETVGNVSSAAKSICMWVRAMHTYDRVAKNIAPKKAKLASAEEDLAKVEEELGVKKAALQEVLNKVAGLKRTLKAAQQKSKDLEKQAAKTEVQLVRAEKLIDSLGGEKVRWGISAEKLSKDNINLVGNMILSAGCIAYLGAFTMEFRQDITTKWVQFCADKSIPVDSGYTLQNTLGEPVVIREWQIMGLPADEFSTENGMFATMGRRWPLMIDPQGQANRWIKNSNKENNLQVIKLTEKDFLRTLENAIRYGAPVLLENVAETLDPSLEPVLLKQIFKKGGQWLLRLGDSDVPYSNEFRFSITTKLANPHYMPEICIKVTIINFTVTMTGLENQLLVDVIKSERPDLEKKKDELVVAIAADAKQLKGIEDTILQLLANSKGNILDDEKLINVLGESKITSAAIGERMKTAETTTAEINSTRELYRSVATRGSLIYFVIASLALVDPMYQYSLQFYQMVFNTRLEKAGKSDDLNTRLKILIDDISEAMYINICRGLFEKDKMIYIFMICVSVQMHAGIVSASELKCLQIGPGTEPNPTACPDDAKWLQGQPWTDLYNMEQSMPVMKGLTADIVADLGAWKAAFIDAENPHESDLPGKWNTDLSSFQKMLVLRALCTQKTIFAMRVYIDREFGKQFTESPPFDLLGCYEDSTALTPLIFVLSPGADINDYLHELAVKKGKDAQLKIISLGQGQGPIAERLMETGRADGDWVCLQNCHLAVSWLGRMEQNLEVASSKPDDIHEEFRLWLTSMPSDKFPIPVLQSGIKITNEPPKGMKANLRRTFLDMKEEEFEGCTKPAVFKKFIFAVSFFNAMILERRKFGATGWNIAYSWMNSDLKAASQQVRLYLEEQDDVPYETLNSCVAEVTFGGRITDKQDKVTATAILIKYFCPDLLKDGYKFSASGKYYAPPEGTLQEVREYIDTLPLIDTPDTFGLHANADITYQQKLTNATFDTIITLGGGGGGGGEENNNDQLVTDKATVMQEKLLEILPRGEFDLRDAHETTFAKIDGGGTNSMGVFLSQEIIRFNAMLRVMAKTLTDLKRAIKGLIVMSGPLEEMYNCFVYQRVPPEWEKNGYPCLKPLASWTDDHFERLSVTQMWLADGNPDCFWISGFFFPQGFMTAVKQTFSRDYKIAIDTLMVSCVCKDFEQEDVKGSPKDGVYIHGLYAEAARFDRGTMCLEESHPAELFAPMPVMHLLPTKVEDYDNAGTYSCPCYKTSLRFGVLSTTGHSTNQVCNFDIPTNVPKDHWTRRGTALLCMLDY